MTGSAQVDVCVPYLYWSVFDCFKVILMTCGTTWLSMATSDSHKSVKELLWLGDEAVNSLTLKNPKYAVQQAAQIIKL